MTYNLQLTWVKNSSIIWPWNILIWRLFSECLWKSILHNRSCSHFKYHWGFSWWNKANLRDLIAATGPVILLKLDSNSQFFSPCALHLEKQYSTSSILRQALCTISNPWVNSNSICSLETLNSDQNCRFFVPRDLEISWMILETNRAPLLYYVKLCASFQIHRWIQTGVTVR